MAVLQFLITTFFSILLYSGEVILGYKQYLKQKDIESTKRINSYIFHDETEHHRTKFASSFSSLGVRFSNLLPTPHARVVQMYYYNIPLTQNRNQFIVIIQ